jgi:hypothetical protein
MDEFREGYSQKGKEGHRRLKFYQLVRKNLVEDRNFRAYLEGETKQLPVFFSNIIKKDLGIWWQWLRQGTMEHDANAYMHKSSSNPVTYSVNTTKKKILQSK